MAIKIVATNRKARHEFELFDTFEAGLSLQGTEIKSLRAGQASLAQSYVKIDEHEAWLMNAFISSYEEASFFNHDPLRPRKLLLHRKEIHRLWDSVRIRGQTIIPLRIYLKDGLAKVEIALARGKKLHDKRADIAKRDYERDLERQSRQRG
jgi:SsrA-binding protein